MAKKSKAPKSLHELCRDTLTTVQGAALLDALKRAYVEVPLYAADPLELAKRTANHDLVMRLASLSTTPLEDITDAGHDSDDASPFDL